MERISIKVEIYVEDNFRGAVECGIPATMGKNAAIYYADLLFEEIRKNHGTENGSETFPNL